MSISAVELLDVHVRRIERYLTVAWDSGASPVVLLNKADLCDDIEDCISEVESVAIGVPVHSLSAAESQGLEILDEYLDNGKTIAFLGSSGVGKSTLINKLLGDERIKTNAVREFDNKGRHTTTHREMILIPEKGIVIDTPGMREIQIWGDESALEKAFGDIEELGSQCRFRDCSHQGEPGCAIKRALNEGTLDAGRYRSYLKIQKELEHLSRRRSIKQMRSDARARDKMIRQHIKGIKKLKQ